MQDSSIYRLVGQQTLFILLLDTPFQRTVPHPARLERTIACPTLDPQPAFVSKFVVVGRIRASYVHRDCTARREVRPHSGLGVSLCHPDSDSGPDLFN
jgi:hypothetical protein